MKNIKTGIVFLLTLLSPVAATISCSKKVSSDDLVSKNASYVWDESYDIQKIDLDTGISENILSSTSSIRSYLNQDAWDDKWTQYIIQIEGGIKFNFLFDKSLNMNADDETLLIDSFLKETTWGVGLATIQNIVITSRILNPNIDPDGNGYIFGVGDFRPDIIIRHFPVDKLAMGFTDLAEWKRYVMNQILSTLQHEYGHHETMTMYANYANGTMEPISDVLRYNKVYGFEQITLYNPAQINAAKTTLINKYRQLQQNGNPVDLTLNSVFGKCLFYGSMTDDVLNDVFDLEYNYNDAEYLNRYVGMFDLTNLYPAYEPEIYRLISVGVDMFTYALNGFPIMDGQKNYVKAAIDNLDVWGKYVYGYANNVLKNRLLWSNDTLRGYSEENFDFITSSLGPRALQLDGVLSSKYAKVTKAPSHFYKKSKFMGPKEKINSQNWSYYAKLDSSYPEEDFHVYKDTNGDGKLDLNNDQDVTSTFLSTINSFTKNNNKIFGGNPVYYPSREN